MKAPFELIRILNKNFLTFLQSLFERNSIGTLPRKVPEEPRRRIFPFFQDFKRTRRYENAI